MKKLIWIFITLGLIACKKEVEDTAEDNVLNQAFEQEIAVQDGMVQLSPESKRFAAKWLEYITAENEVGRIRNSSIAEVVNNSDVIAQILFSLKNSVPDSLRAIPVATRLNVLNTKAQLLKQYAHKQQPDAEIIGETATSIVTEFDNLKIQMNELFLKSLEEFEKELDNFEENERLMLERDSIANTISQ